MAISSDYLKNEDNEYRFNFEKWCLGHVAIVVRENVGEDDGKDDSCEDGQGGENVERRDEVDPISFLLIQEVVAIVDSQGQDSCEYDDRRNAKAYESCQLALIVVYKLIVGGEERHF